MKVFTIFLQHNKELVKTKNAILQLLFISLEKNGDGRRETHRRFLSSSQTSHVRPSLRLGVSLRRSVYYLLIIFINFEFTLFIEFELQIG